MHLDANKCIALLAALAVVFQRIAAEKGSDDADADQRRRRTKDTTTKDPKEAEREAALALSREIFRNITKQLRETLAAKGVAIQDSEEKVENEDSENELHPFRHHPPYQQKHHHEHHWGPYFEPDDFSPGSKASPGVSEPRGALQVTAHLASEALLSCRVGMLKDKTVMWLRRRLDAFQLLTVASATYSGDSRISVKFQYPNNWRLSINPVKKEDAGLYMCQVSTHPPRALLSNLTVLAPILRIVDDQGHEVRDRYYKAGSALELTCRVSRYFTGAASASAGPSASGSRLPAPKKLKKRQTYDETSATTVTENYNLKKKTPEYSEKNYIGSTIISNEQDESLIDSIQLNSRHIDSENVKDVDIKMRWKVDNSTTASDTTTTTADISKTTESTLMNVTLQISTTTVSPATKNSTSSNSFGVIWKKDGNILIDGVKSTNTSSTFRVDQAELSDSGVYSCTFLNTTTVAVQVHVLSGETHAAVQHDTLNGGRVLKSSMLNIIVNIVLFISFLLIMSKCTY